MRSVATGAALAFALPVVGCGDDEPERPGPGAAARVIVEVRSDGTAATARRRTVDCDEAATCRRLLRADFRPTGRKILCTDNYGGRATARVRGVVRGRPLDAEFSLVNGCEIARWQRLAWLLGPPPQG